MRTLVDIEDHNLGELDRLARQHRRSRAALIREAIGEYISRHSTTPLEEAFGLWGNKGVDGLEYQEKVRAEW